MNSSRSPSSSSSGGSGGVQDGVDSVLLRDARVALGAASNRRRRGVEGGVW